MAESQERPLHELLSHSLVDIHVGPTSTRFPLHEKLLCARSPFFQKIFHSTSSPFATPKASSKPKSFALPDDDTDAFTTFVGWLYGGSLPFPREEAHLGGLFELYLMGEKWAVKSLCAETLERVRDWYRDSDTYPGLRRVQYVYANTTAESPMRRLLVSATARMLVTKDPNAEQPIPMHWDKALRKNGQLAVDLIRMIQEWRIEETKVPDARRGDVVSDVKRHGLGNEINSKVDDEVEEALKRGEVDDTLVNGEDEDEDEIDEEAEEDASGEVGVEEEKTGNGNKEEQSEAGGEEEKVEDSDEREKAEDDGEEEDDVGGTAEKRSSLKSESDNFGEETVQSNNETEDKIENKAVGILDQTSVNAQQDEVESSKNANRLKSANDTQKPQPGAPDKSIEHQTVCDETSVEQPSDETDPIAQGPDQNDTGSSRNEMTTDEQHLEEPVTPQITSGNLADNESVTRRLDEESGLAAVNVTTVTNNTHDEAADTELAVDKHSLESDPSDDVGTSRDTIAETPIVDSSSNMYPIEETDSEPHLRPASGNEQSDREEAPQPDITEPPLTTADDEQFGPSDNDDFHSIESCKHILHKQPVEEPRQDQAQGYDNDAYRSDEDIVTLPEDSVIQKQDFADKERDQDIGEADGSVTNNSVPKVEVENRPQNAAGGDLPAPETADEDSSDIAIRETPSTADTTPSENAQTNEQVQATQSVDDANSSEDDAFVKEQEPDDVFLENKASEAEEVKDLSNPPTSDPAQDVQESASSAPEASAATESEAIHTPETGAQATPSESESSEQPPPSEGPSSPSKTAKRRTSSASKTSEQKDAQPSKRSRYNWLGGRSEKSEGSSYIYFPNSFNFSRRMFGS
ncbi:MAG: hypothetical protein M1820_010567 [Bogoriella megaspora]|nr:MAG: hypothetical protein M1820_010567 [Bogoriella megaspora]